MSLTWIKNSRTGHYESAGTAGKQFTIKRRDDGYFDLFAGRKKINEKRDRLAALKGVADQFNETSTSETPPEPAEKPAGRPLVEVLADEPAENDPRLNRLLTEAEAENRVNELKRQSAPIQPKASDMVSRAVLALDKEERKAVPVPGMNHRTKPDPLQVEADWNFLYTWEGEYKVKLNNGEYVTPQVAFARVPRGTARKLRKALRAAGRLDLAAVSRLPPGWENEVDV